MIEAASSTLPLLVLPALRGNDPTHVSAMQEFIIAHLRLFETFWWLVFGVAALVVILGLYREWCKAR